MYPQYPGIGGSVRARLSSVIYVSVVLQTKCLVINTNAYGNVITKFMFIVYLYLNIHYNVDQICDFTNIIIASSLQSPAAVKEMIQF
jgi:hypothetical protein